MKVIWTRKALAQKDAIWDFWADRTIAYADRVEARIEARAASLAQLPRQGRPLRDVDVRRLSIPDLQYIVDYRIEEAVVRILRVRSTAQDEER